MTGIYKEMAALQRCKNSDLSHLELELGCHSDNEVAVLLSDHYTYTYFLLCAPDYIIYILMFSIIKRFLYNSITTEIANTIFRGHLFCVHTLYLQVWKSQRQCGEDCSLR